MRYKKPMLEGITFRVTPKQRRMLNELAEEMDRSVSDTMRILLIKEWNRRKSKVPTRRP